MVLSLGHILESIITYILNSSKKYRETKNVTFSIILYIRMYVCIHKERGDMEQEAQVEVC